MPKVSEGHREARRRQILNAGRRCFARDGFHATTMQDVFAEAGLSAGAVYSYFGSKNELVTAIADEVLGEIKAGLAAAAEAKPVIGVAEAVTTELAPRLAAGGSVGDFVPIVLQVWAEAVRDEQMWTFVNGVYEEVAVQLARIVTRNVEAGLLPADTHPYATARALSALIQGFIVQRAVLGDVPPEAITEAVTTFAAGIATAPPHTPPGR